MPVTELIIRMHDTEWWQCHACVPPAVSMLEAKHCEAAHSLHASSFTAVVPDCAKRSRCSDEAVWHLCARSDFVVPSQATALVSPPRTPAPPLLHAPVHYFRVPKTGSSLIVEALLPEMQCDTEVVVHDHGDGCRDLSWCYGSHAHWQRLKSFTVMREPCDRFVSVVDHMRAEAPTFLRDAQPLLGFKNAQRERSSDNFTIELFLDWLGAARNQLSSGRGCPRGGAGVLCTVRAVNAAYDRPERVVLWPQAFFTPPHAPVLCFSHAHLANRVTNLVGNMVGDGCRVRQPKVGEENPRVNTRPEARTSRAVLTKRLCGAIRELHDEDARLWDASCG